MCVKLRGRNGVEEIACVQLREKLCGGNCVRNCAEEIAWKKLRGRNCVCEIAWKKLRGRNCVLNCMCKIECEIACVPQPYSPAEPGRV